MSTFRSGRKYYKPSLIILFRIIQLINASQNPALIEHLSHLAGWKSIEDGFFISAKIKESLQFNRKDAMAEYNSSNNAKEVPWNIHNPIMPIYCISDYNYTENTYWRIEDTHQLTANDYLDF
jgi:hypothetical protein